MNFDNDALFKALGVGAGVGLLVGIVGNIPVLGLACCCLGPLLYIASGVAYGYFTDQNGNPVDMASWLLGGAATGAVAGLVGGVVNAIALLLFQALGMGVDMASQLAQLEQAGVDIPPEFAGAVVGGGAATITGALIGICTSFFINAVLAAIGALIFALVKQNQGGSTAPAV